MLHIKPHIIFKKLFLMQSTASLFSFEDINFTNRLTENILDHDKEHRNQFKTVKVAEIFFPRLKFSKQTKKSPNKEKMAQALK